MTSVAKIFRNGRSQAVRLPAEFRFDVSEVLVRRDEATGDLILSKRPSGWENILAAADRARLEATDDLVERRDEPPQERELL